MTTAVERSIPAWQRQPGLSWWPRTGGFVLCAEPTPPGECLDRNHGGRTEVVARVAPPAPGLENLCGFDALLDVLLPLVRRHAPHVADEHGHVVELVVSSRRSEHIGRLVPISEAAALGTTRRVSRESHTAALWIDDAARFVAAAAAELAAADGPVAVAVDAIDHWDRPSLRILHRAVVLGDGARPLWVHGRLRRWAPGRPIPHGGVVDELRTSFLTSLAVRPTTVVRADAAPGGPAPAGGVVATVGQALRAGDDVLLRLLGDALALQNFERVHLLADAARPMVTDPDLTTHLHRLSAISRAQAGAIDAAMDELAEAAATSRRQDVTAHLHYLRALLTTKRRYDLVNAVEQYMMAMRTLDGVEDTPEVLVERAWVHNGLGLAAAMRAREATDEAERRRHYDEAFDHEFAAFRLVRGVPGMSAFYLRYNLGYNLSFLLEIVGRYEEAQRFLTSVASLLLAANRADFGALYKYAIAILQLKAGAREAAATMREAVDLAHSLRDPFYLERLQAALGYTAQRAGDHAAALAAYIEGARIARHLRDPQAYRQQLAGALWSAALGELDCPPDLLASAADWYPDVVTAFRAGSPGEQVAALEASDAQVPVPSSKLPSYVPIVDLEGTPQRDLNRFLAGVASTESPTGRSRP